MNKAGTVSRSGQDVGLARPAMPALKRGLRNRCPACGEGRILHSYLKVHESCAACGEELHHHRADDFPPYLTMFVVGHVVGVIFFAVSDLDPDLPMAVHYAVWPLLAVILSLWLLPIVKGMLIAYQWALRMHGFETAHRIMFAGERPVVSGRSVVDRVPPEETVRRTAA